MVGPIFEMNKPDFQGLVKSNIPRYIVSSARWIGYINDIASKTITPFFNKNKNKTNNSER